MAQLNYTVAQINAILAKALAMTVPTLLSQLTNDEGFIKTADIPTKTSDLTNDSGFITNEATQAIIDEFANYYTKDESYSKTEVNALVNALEQSIQSGGSYSWEQIGNTAIVIDSITTSEIDALFR